MDAPSTWQPVFRFRSTLIGLPLEGRQALWKKRRISAGLRSDALITTHTVITTHHSPLTTHHFISHRLTLPLARNKQRQRTPWFGGWDMAPSRLPRLQPHNVHGCWGGSEIRIPETLPCTAFRRLWCALADKVESRDFDTMCHCSACGGLAA